MKKCLHHLQKISMVMSCVRESERAEPPDYKIIPKDVDAAWSIVSHSINTMKYFKADLAEEFEDPQIVPLSEEEIDESILLQASDKIFSMYSKTTNYEVSLIV